MTDQTMRKVQWVCVGSLPVFFGAIICWLTWSNLTKGQTAANVLCSIFGGIIIWVGTKGFIALYCILKDSDLGVRPSHAPPNLTRATARQSAHSRQTVSKQYKVRALDRRVRGRRTSRGHSASGSR